MAFVDMETYRLIRRLHVVEGLSQRQIAVRTGVSRTTVRRYCLGEVLPDVRKEYRIEKSPLRLQLEKEILRLLEAHKEEPTKQQLNARIIWKKIVDQGYTIGESTIRKYIQEMRIDLPEVFIPLEFEPGEAMEFDWGEAYVYLNKVKTIVSLFCAVLPYSYGIFCAVFPDKTSSSFFAGHVMAFEHFQGVPTRCIYDNLKSAVLDGSGKNAMKQDKFKKLEAHYAFEGVFCNAESGWEKGSVENLVSIVRKIAFTPVPTVRDYPELQAHVTRQCAEYCMTHQIKGRPASIRDMLEEEKKHLLPLPLSPMDTAEELKATVQHDLTVLLNGTKYSVPAAYIGLSVTLKVFPFQVQIFYRGQQLYVHRKATHRGDHQYIPAHYLDILERKPRAIPNAVPLKRGVMPPELTEFLRLCPHGDKNRQLVNLLLLGRKVDPDMLLWAVRQANATGTPSYDLVCLYLEIQAEDKPHELVPEVKINPARFDKYDALIKRRDPDDETHTE